VAINNTIVAVVAGIAGLAMLGIGLGIAIPALVASESGAPSAYTDALGIGYLMLGLSPVALVAGLFFLTFMGRKE
jgi:hypothetical protein